MSIQRYSVVGLGSLTRDDDGGWVRMSDHVAEVERVQDVMTREGIAYAHRRAEAMRAACIAAVEALPWSTETWQAHDERAAVLAALREVTP